MFMGVAKLPTASLSARLAECGPLEYPRCTSPFKGKVRGQLKARKETVTFEH